MRLGSWTVMAKLDGWEFDFGIYPLPLVSVNL
jgi:hypothetical protein